MKKYITPNGSVVDESSLRTKYGSKFDELVLNGTFKLHSGNTVKTPNGSVIDESVAKSKYGERYNELINSGTLKKKETTPPSGSNGSNGSGVSGVSQLVEKVKKETNNNTSFIPNIPFGAVDNKPAFGAEAQKENINKQITRVDDKFKNGTLTSKDIEDIVPYNRELAKKIVKTYLPNASDDVIFSGEVLSGIDNVNGAYKTALKKIENNNATKKDFDEVAKYNQSAALDLYQKSYGVNSNNIDDNFILSKNRERKISAADGNYQKYKDVAAKNGFVLYKDIQELTPEQKAEIFIFNGKVKYLNAGNEDDISLLVEKINKKIKDDTYNKAEMEYYGYSQPSNKITSLDETIKKVTKDDVNTKNELLKTVGNISLQNFLEKNNKSLNELTKQDLREISKKQYALQNKNKYAVLESDINKDEVLQSSKDKEGNIDKIALEAYYDNKDISKDLEDIGINAVYNYAIEKGLDIPENIKQIKNTQIERFPEIADKRIAEKLASYNYKKTSWYQNDNVKQSDIDRWATNPEFASMFSDGELNRLKTGAFLQKNKEYDLFGNDVAILPSSGWYESIEKGLINGFRPLYTGARSFISDNYKRDLILNDTKNSDLYLDKTVGDSQEAAQEFSYLEQKKNSPSGLSETEKKEYDNLYNEIHAQSEVSQWVDKMFNTVGMVAGQALGTKGVGLIGKAATTALVGKNAIIGAEMLAQSRGITQGLSTVKNVVSGATFASATSYSDIAKEAMLLFPDDKGKQRVFLGLNLAATAGTEYMFRDTKVLDAFNTEIRASVTNFVRNVRPSDITDAAVNNLLHASTLKFVGRYAKEMGIENTKETVEETTTQLVNSISKIALGDKEYDVEKAFKDIGNTAKETFISTPIVSALAARTNIMEHGYGRKNIYNAAVNAKQYLKEVDRQEKNNEITPQEASTSRFIIEQAGIIQKNEPSKVSILSLGKKSTYLTNTLNIKLLEKKLENKNLDDNERKDIEAEIAISKKNAELIYNGTSTVSDRYATDEESEIESIENRNDPLRDRIAQQPEMLEALRDNLKAATTDEERNAIQEQIDQVEKTQTKDVTNLPITEQGGLIPTGKKIFTDFDETLWDNKNQKLTPLGEEMKAKIASGEDITILTARVDKDGKDTDFIADKLGISKDKIKTDLSPEQKASNITAGSVFYDDNEDNLKAAKDIFFPLETPTEVIDSKEVNKNTEQGKETIAFTPIKEVTLENYDIIIAENKDAIPELAKMADAPKGKTAIMIANKAIDKYNADKQKETDDYNEKVRNEFEASKQTTQDATKKTNEEITTADPNKTDTGTKPISSAKNRYGDVEETHYNPFESEGKALERLASGLTSTSDEAIEKAAKEHADQFKNYVNENGGLSDEASTLSRVQRFEQQTREAIHTYLDNPTNFDAKKENNFLNGARIDEKGNVISEEAYVRLKEKLKSLREQRNENNDAEITEIENNPTKYYNENKDNLIPYSQGQENGNLEQPTTSNQSETEKVEAPTTSNVVVEEGSGGVGNKPSIKNGDKYNDAKGVERIWGENTEADKTHEIEQMLKATAEGAAMGATIQSVNDFKAGKEIIFRKPQSIKAAKNNPNYNVEIQSDGSAKVIGVLDPRNNEWVGIPKSNVSENKSINIVDTPSVDIINELNKLNTIEEKLNWLKENNLIVPIEVNGKLYNSIDYDERVMVLAKCGKYNIPFYISTGQAGKKNVKAGNWYAVFGIGESGWINKGTEEYINKQYDFPVFQKIARILNEGLGTYESGRANGNLDSNIGDLQMKDINSFNSQTNLPITPAKNAKESTVFWANVNEILKVVNNELVNITKNKKAEQSLKETTKVDNNLNNNTDANEQQLTEQDNIEQEPIVKAIEGKAESTSQVELNEAVVESEKLLNNANVFITPIADLKTDPQRFQPRDANNSTDISSLAEKLAKGDNALAKKIFDIIKETTGSLKSIETIVKSFTMDRMLPLKTFTDSNGDTYVANHSRLAAHKILSILPPTNEFKESALNNGFEDNVIITSPVSKNTTEKQFIELAQESNNDATQNTDFENANLVRTWIKDGLTKTEINEKAKQLFGKNWVTITNIAYLNKSGKLIEALKTLNNSEDAQSQGEVRKIADWVGDIRRTNSKVTDAHETELFDFLMNKNESARFKNKADFIGKVSSITTAFDFDNNKPLNIARYKYKTDGEKLYDQEVEQLKNEIKQTQSEVDAIKDRLLNPNNTQYVNPNSPDYAQTKKVADDIIAKTNAIIQSKQKKLQELYLQKGKMTNAGSNQASLFSIGTPQTKSQIKAVQKIIDYISKGLKTKIFAPFSEFESKLKEILGTDINYLKTPSGKVLGFVSDGKIYLNPNAVTPETAWHELSHIQQQVIRALAKSGDEAAQKILNRWERIAKENDIVAQIRKDKKVVIEGKSIPLDANVYEQSANETDAEYEQRILDEVWAYLISPEAQKQWKNATKFTSKVKAFFEAISSYFKDKLGYKGNKNIHNATLDELILSGANSLLKKEYLSNKELAKREQNDELKSKNIDAKTKNEIKNLNLQTLNKISNEIINGTRLSKRYSQGESDGIKRGGEILSETILYLGANESTSGEVNNKENQEGLIEKYAKAKGVWFNNTRNELTSKYGEPIFDLKNNKNQEAIIFAKDGNTVIKSQNIAMYGFVPINKIDSIVLQNTYFEEAAVKVVGFGRDENGNFQVVVEQDFIKAHPTEKVTNNAIKEHLSSIGFSKQLDNSQHTNKENTVIVDDLHTSNAILTPKGNIVVFDPLMRMNTAEKGYGGTRVIGNDFLNNNEDTFVSSPKVNIDDNGNIILQRLRQEEEQGRNSSGQINAEATIVLSGVHRATEKKFGTNSRELATIKQDEERYLETFAKSNGTWFGNADKIFGNFLDKGQENRVYLDKNNTTIVTKINDLSLNENWLTFLDRIALHNTIFPSTSYIIKGFGKDSDGKFIAVLEQPFIQSYPLSQQEIVDYMAGKDFELLSKYDEDLIDTKEQYKSFINKNTGVIVSDLHLNNVRKDTNGNIFVIDPVIELDTEEKGYGSNRETALPDMEYEDSNVNKNDTRFSILSGESKFEPQGEDLETVNAIIDDIESGAFENLDAAIKFYERVYEKKVKKIVVEYIKKELKNTEPKNVFLNHINTKFRASMIDLNNEVRASFGLDNPLFRSGVIGSDVELQRVATLSKQGFEEDDEITINPVTQRVKLNLETKAFELEQSVELAKQTFGKNYMTKMLSIAEETKSPDTKIDILTALYRHTRKILDSGVVDDTTSTAYFINKKVAELSKEAASNLSMALNTLRLWDLGNFGNSATDEIVPKDKGLALESLKDAMMISELSDEQMDAWQEGEQDQQDFIEESETEFSQRKPSTFDKIKASFESKDKASNKLKKAYKGVLNTKEQTKNLVKRLKEAAKNCK